ncbi:hypothetical protein [Citromicrobium bathyomarinum]|uniref:hypothetical protein n=1 Tax=Citromicrobium bathyomarinum TaxID=72174 RepID=UPI001E3C5FCA|nr:hypothetical protein [Citromicrobium bathyomarinum]
MSGVFLCDIRKAKSGVHFAPAMMPTKHRGSGAMRVFGKAICLAAISAMSLGNTQFGPDDLRAAMLETSIDRAQLVITDQLKAIYTAKAEIHHDYRFGRDHYLHNVRQIGFVRRCTLLIRTGKSLLPGTQARTDPNSEYDLGGGIRFEQDGTQVKLASPTTFRSYSSVLIFPNETEAVKFSAAMNPLASDCRELATLG